MLLEQSTLQKHQSDRLIFLGVLLFFFGLIIGVLVPVLANPRMGLSSHIEGVLNGMLLILFGLIWHKVDLPSRWLTITFGLAIYGTFANWLGILIAAIFDAGGMLTVAANGQKGPPVAEGIVTFSLLSLSIAMLIVCVAVLVGLARNMRENR
jgi:hydroxylaminobenzene mutase